MAENLLKKLQDQGWLNCDDFFWFLREYHPQAKICRRRFRKHLNDGVIKTRKVGYERQVTRIEIARYLSQSGLSDIPNR